MDQSKKSKEGTEIKLSQTFNFMRRILCGCVCFYIPLDLMILAKIFSDSKVETMARFILNYCYQ